MRKRVRASVRGRVQGVGFRAYAIRHAGHLGIAGWVRNCPDGTVEILAEAEASNLEKFLEAVGRGPAHASVREVRAEWAEPCADLSGFTVRW